MRSGISGLRLMGTTTALVGVLASAAVLLAPAHAAERVFRDADDAPARVDVRATRVGHGSRALRVVVRLDDLRRNPGRGLDDVVVFVDTRRSRTGPEFHSSIQGFHWYFGRVRNWRPVPSSAPNDPYTSGCRGLRADPDLRRDTVAFVMPRTRRCIGQPARVRVSVLAAHALDDSGSRYVVDHAPARRRFYRWVRVG